MDNACIKDGIEWSYKKIDNGFSFIFSRYESDIVLNDCALVLLRYMKNNNGILENISRAIEITNKKDRVTREGISQLLKYGIIERVGSRKKGYWKVCNE